MKGSVILTQAPAVSDGGRSERKCSMLTILAIIEKKCDDKGKELTPEVLVPAEDVAVKGKAGIRETMLVKYAKKLEGKDLTKVEVVCSDFQAV